MVLNIQVCIFLFSDFFYIFHTQMHMYHFFFIYNVCFKKIELNAEKQYQYTKNIFKRLRQEFIF